MRNSRMYVSLAFDIALSYQTRMHCNTDLSAYRTSSPKDSLRTPRPQAAIRSARQLVEREEWAPNAHRYWWRVRSPLRIILNYLVIFAAMHCPSLSFKRTLFRWLGMKLGDRVTVASGVTLDYFFPELIRIGDDTIIGMNTLLLTHEFLHDRWRRGPLSIGPGVLVGANSTILAGVTIGAGAQISAATFVNRDIPPGARAGGNPMTVRESTWMP